METSERKGNNIGVLRLALAALVIVSHVFGIPNSPQSDSWRLGRIAVDGFFVLSGYLMYQSWLRHPSPRAFTLNRVLRIYPGFVVASLFCAYVVGPLAASGAYWPRFDVHAFALNALHLAEPAIPPVFQGLPLHAVDLPMWTIGFEARCYCAVVVLGAVGLVTRRWPLAVICLVAGAVYIGCELHMMRLSPSLYWWPRFITTFAAGMTFAAYPARLAITGQRAGIAVVVLFAAHFTPGYTAVMPACVAFIVLYLAYGTKPRISTNGVDLSYGVYLYAFPVQQLISLYAPGMTSTALFLSTVAVTAPLAALSWFIVERPALRVKQRPPRLVNDRVAVSDRADSRVGVCGVTREGATGAVDRASLVGVEAEGV